MLDFASSRPTPKIGNITINTGSWFSGNNTNVNVGRPRK
jgi:hypothetical protein